MIINLNDKNFEENVLKSSLPVLVDFWAPWCGPCQMVGTIIEELAEENEGKIKVGKVNVDESPQTAGKYGVMSIPTVILFKEGKEVARKVGFEGKEAYLKIISNV
ncbi:thioredoxin [Patescibacteria group bacterium]|nr:thioredoxin [Patescibacteria group bacterium]